MKHYRLPDDIEFPELDDKTKAELDAAFARMERLHPPDPNDVPDVEFFRPEFLRTLPAQNRAMYKYGFLQMVREYEDFMRSHPELDKD
ncbi:hypothetical protein [Pseudoduganella sp. OTU4001]|uniref:hypothetical protein n=1 Tax=Pseudoduganella sp. OTU4001 TaxID=3043854 RepID=UPI00313E5BC2